MYWSCIGHVLVMYWSCIGHVLVMCWSCVGHWLVLCWPGIGHCWSVIGHVLVIVGHMWVIACQLLHSLPPHTSTCPSTSFITLAHATVPVHMNLGDTSPSTAPRLPTRTLPPHAAMPLPAFLKCNRAGHRRRSGHRFMEHEILFSAALPEHASTTVVCI